MTQMKSQSKKKGFLFEKSIEKHRLYGNLIIQDDKMQTY